MSINPSNLNCQFVVHMLREFLYLLRNELNHHRSKSYFSGILEYGYIRPTKPVKAATETSSVLLSAYTFIGEATTTCQTANEDISTTNPCARSTRNKEMPYNEMVDDSKNPPVAAV